jgi:hypothetical protein
VKVYFVVPELWPLIVFAGFWPLSQFLDLTCNLKLS